MKQNFTDYLQNVVTKAKRSEMRHGVASEINKNGSIRTGIHREPSLSETNREAKQPNHHYIFCSHEVPYWRCCAKCGRDKNLAARNAELVLKHVGGAAFFTK
jgi:hypothetical protein